MKSNAVLYCRQSKIMMQKPSQKRKRQSEKRC